MRIAEKTAGSTMSLMRRGCLGLGVLLASIGCSLVVDTHCFTGECIDGSLPDASHDSAVDAPLDATDANVDAADGSVASDASDAAPDVAPDANDVCFNFTQDPCRNVTSPNGGCYCGTSTQSGFDTASANPNCIYRCNTGTTPTRTDSAKICSTGCNVAAPGTEDYCKNQSACTVSTSYCYQTCTN